MDIQIKHKADKNTSFEKIISYLLKDRGVKDEKEFFNPKHPYSISLYEALGSDVKTDWKKTCQLLKKIYKEKSMIVICSDYDADGVTGCAIVWETLYILGFNVMPYIPDRKKEGYGFSRKVIDSIYEKYKPSLVISIDHGIVAEKEVFYAKKYQIPIIITDHHEKIKKFYPKSAYAVFHTYSLSGSGIAYFFAKEIYTLFKNVSKKSHILESFFIKDYLFLSAIGTVSDLVPLVGVNRAIVKYGIKEAKNVKREGIRALFEEADIKDRKISVFEIGYYIAPLINVFGRLSNAIEALRLLCTSNSIKAKGLAQKAGITNKKRQELVEVSIQEAFNKVRKEDKIIILTSNHWNEGIIGLIASRIAEKYCRPAIVMTKTGRIFKGSARSYGTFDIISFIRKLEKYLIDAGGHKAAAGFSLKRENKDKFVREIEHFARKNIDEKHILPQINVDFEIPLSFANIKFCSLLEKFEPFGVGNPQPIFLSKCKILESRPFGEDKKHILFQVTDGDNVILHIKYFKKFEDYSFIKKNSVVKCVYKLNLSEYNGAKSIDAIGIHAYCKDNYV